MDKRLTEFSHGSGCGCKIAPADLATIIGQVDFSKPNDNLLIGHGSNEDAAVYDLGNGTALITTTDFFTPIVDDPISFGKIAAANALSDVYAMGGRPIVAIAVLGWPIGKIPLDVASKVLEGGRQKCEEIGISMAGGHSIDAPEPFFGLAVNGLIDIPNIKRNSRAKEGDFLFLTKPIGTGIISTAIKRAKAKQEHIDLAIDQMESINVIGQSIGKLDYVNAMTDVTGFGLLGHLIEMCEASNLTAEITFDRIPLIDDNAIHEYLDQFIFPDNTFRNFNAYKDKVNEMSGRQLQILCDPQTNGGLLVAVQESNVEDFVTYCLQQNIVVESFGKFLVRGEKTVLVK